MSKEIVKIYSEHEILFSESDSDTLDAKIIICDFDPNKNDVALNPNTINDWVSTINIKPLVGKVITKYSGESDFSGHNAKIVKKLDAEGNEYQDIELDTSSFGAFYSSAIENIDGKDYIVANAKIWKRFSQAYEVIKRRIDTNTGIKTSWEIQILESHYETIDGRNVKVIDQGIFIGHCLLGESVSPAYDSSGILQVASSNEQDTELTEALARDVQLSISTKNVIEEEIEMPKDTNVSALTTRDLYQKIYSAMNPKGWNSNPYYSVVSVYPEDHKVIAYDIERESEDEFVSATYTVTGDEVSIGETVKTQMSKMLAEKSNVNITLDLNETAKLLSEKETEIKALISDKELLTTQLSEKVDALLVASQMVEQLQSSVDELTPFKEQAEEIQRVAKEEELSQKKEDLKKTALKGGFISEAELESSEEIKALIEQLDVASIKGIIADRFIKKLEETDVNSTVVTSTVTKEVTLSTKKIIDTDEGIVSHKTIMSSFLQNN